MQKWREYDPVEDQLDSDMTLRQAVWMIVLFAAGFVAGLATGLVGHGL